MLVQYTSAANIRIKNKSRKYFAGFILKCCVIMLFLTIFTQYGNLLAECIGQQIGYHSGAIYIIMCIVLLALWLRRLFAGSIPHVQLLRRLGSQTLLQVVGNGVGIYKVAVHAGGHILWCHTIQAVGIVKRVALNHFYAILKG